MTPDDQQTTLPFATLSDEALLERLLHAGLDVPPGLPQELVRRGEAVVAPLCAWRQDDELRQSEEDDGWAPLHALHVLGAIGSPAAIPAVLSVAVHPEPEEAVHDSLSCILARFGPAVVKPATELLRTWPADAQPTTLSDVVRGLVTVGRDHPEERPGLARLFVELLSDPACDADERTAWAVSELATVNEPEVVEAVAAAFERGAAGWVVGEEELQEVRAGSPAWSPVEYRADPAEWFSDDSLGAYRMPADWSPGAIAAQPRAPAGPATGERRRGASRSGRQAKARRKAARARGRPRCARSGIGAGPSGRSAWTRRTMRTAATSCRRPTGSRRTSTSGRW